MLHPVPVLKETPSQTAGPYVHIGMTPNFCDLPGLYAADMGSQVLFGTIGGERITITLRLLDGAGIPVADGLIEIWQADAEGRYPEPSRSQPAFTGWGRQAADADGMMRFETIRPGAVPGPDGKPMAPHVSLWIVARGINMGLQSRLYFEDEAAANDGDIVLNRIMDTSRRQTLIARREEGAVPDYRLDIHLQGAQETVFFDF